MNEETKLVIKRRLADAGLSWACTWDGAGVATPKRDNVEQADYDAAKLIIETTVAEGERRFKTPEEFWQEMQTYPIEAIVALLKWRDVIALREWAIRQPKLFEEAMSQAAKELESTHPQIHADLQAAGKLTFDATEIDDGG